jgi:hypothetical protein
MGEPVSPQLAGTSGGDLFEFYQESHSQKPGTSEMFSRGEKD